MFMNFFKIMTAILKFSIFLRNEITYFNNITSITFTSHKNGFSSKKQPKLYKFNRRSKTMFGISLN